MDLLNKAWEKIKKILGKSKLAIPLKDDGSINEDMVACIYVVLDQDGTPLYIVALTSWGTETEPASPVLLNALKSFGRQIIQLSLEDFVMHYHHATALNQVGNRAKHGF